MSAVEASGRSDRRHLGFAWAAAALLLVAGVLLGWQSEANYRRSLVRQAQVQASIIADSLTAALAFDDQPTMEAYVRALRADPRVAHASVFDTDGRQLVRYGAEARPSALQDGQTAFRNGVVEAVAPVRQNGVRLGYVYIKTAREPFTALLQRHSGLGLLTVMAFLLLAVVGNATEQLQRRAEALTQANARLQTEMAERARVEEALRQSQKMEALGQLTGGVAHDFNNLLTVIMGGLETIGRHLANLPPGADTARLLRARNMAHHGATRAATLTQRLLAFSRRQPLRPQALDPTRLIIGMTDLLQRTLGETVELETVVAAGVGRIRVDGTELENALVNLAVNARDAMPTGGRLTIECANAVLDEAYVAQIPETLPPGPYVLIAVTDTGAGMSAETLSHVFEPFFTTKEVGKGTGLGLSQVYGFVRQSGGYVTIYSEVGEGTTVKLYLPRHAGAAEAEKADAPLSSDVLLGDEKVLVVEDHPDLRTYSAGILTELGYKVREAGAGAEALKILEDEPGFDLLFTDVILPGGMNGRELADAAVAANPTLKVLFTTGYTRNAIVHNGALDPGVELISKPFTFQDLAAAMRRVLDARPPAGGGATPA